MLKPFLVMSALLAPAPALAADAFITGVYLNSEELCAKAKAEGLQTVIESGEILLTEHGLEGIEYNCEFVQIIRATRAPAWAVTAVCQEPGYLFPDVLTVLEMNPTHLDLVSVKPADPESGVSGNSGSYVLCEGVAAP